MQLHRVHGIKQGATHMDNSKLQSLHISEFSNQDNSSRTTIFLKVHRNLPNKQCLHKLPDLEGYLL